MWNWKAYTVHFPVKSDEITHVVMKTTKPDKVVISLAHSYRIFIYQEQENETLSPFKFSVYT